MAATGSPITFIGSGERMDDLQEFDPQWFVSQLLGWGNVKGLMQKVSVSHLHACARLCIAYRHSLL